MTKDVGYKATFRFFKVICKLKLVHKTKIKIDLWRAIRQMLLTRTTP